MTVTLLPYDFFRGARYFLYIFFVVVPPASQAWAGDGDIPSASDRGRLDAVERALTQERGAQQELDAETRALSGEITELRKELVFAARSAQESENALSEVEATLDQLNANVSHLRSELLERRRQITSTLAALERVALQPPESVIFQPGTAQNAVRSALLLRAVVPPLEARSRSLGKDLSAFAELRREIATRHDELLNTTHELEDNRVRLDGLLRRKSLLYKRVERDSRQTAARMRKLATEARSLRDLLSRLEEGGTSGQGDEVWAQAGESEDTEIAAFLPPLQRALLPSGIPFSRARGKILFPVRGRLVTRYGESSSTAGLAARGLTLATRKEARVVAPYDGEVVFTGPFRGYGKILIIAHGEGYHLLLAGLSRIDSAVGQALLAGEPVGVMGRPENSEPNLYMELHHKGEPINPLPWLAANRKKVSS
ncbi:MAG TPA: peptidoglycan DD-metalloendopeptidase family protein [Alphaproteobacteria bacterium]|nr:peptidoglycan DD-metalloendopeptidase family protein [Alphaproteobacteria bacterium]